MALTLIEGSFVEIVGFEGRIRPLTETGEEDPAADVLEPNGIRGRVVQRAEDGRYLVQSFSGIYLGVEDEHLVGFDVPSPEEGGFDFYFPDFMEDSDVQDSCAMVIGRHLSEKGYCAIQLTLTSSDQSAAVLQAARIGRWLVPDNDFEPAYMGRDNTTKYSMLLAGVHVEHDEPEDALAVCDQVFNRIAVALEPVCPSLGFDIWGRMNSMVRVHATRDEMCLLRKQALSDSSCSMERIGGHLNFLERRRLCMMLWVHNEGGDFLLHPKDEVRGREVRIPLSPNKMIIFKHDTCSYSYRPEGQSMAIQTWLVSESPEQRLVRNSVVLPLPLVGRARPTCLSTRCSFPGESDDYMNFWTAQAGGTDSLSRVPIARWDVDAYYMDESSDGSTTYTKHGGFVSSSSLVYFDNELFTIDLQEAKLVGPGQRLVLEVGFGALVGAGYDKRSLRGANCGVFLGDSGNEWPYIVAQGELRQEHGACAGMSNCVTGSRLHHILGLVGPCSVVDTACSSGLVATNLAHAALKQSAGWAAQSDNSNNVVSRIDTAMAMGMGLLLTPLLYCKYSAAMMLSQRGRCLSFDGSADGYARGEGCGGIVVRFSQSEEDLQSSLACLIGSCTNQDGKSASMTAPNGPSQQECIRKSLAQCQPSIKLSDITIAECHGTGTVLGDPIEFGAIRNVMDTRETPMLMLSAKSSIGHLEACAGIAGVIKCFMMVQHCCGTPNAHLQALNPNLGVQGFPAVFGTEMIDIGRSDTISGVSSFGFGGTNARSDVWGRAVVGARRVENVDSGKPTLEREKRFARIIDKWFCNVASSHSPEEVHITGTWNAFKTLNKMELVSSGEYLARVVICDEALSEQFFIILNQAPSDQVVHPTVQNADQRAKVAHPGENPEGLRWLIRGRADSASLGTVYEVRFKWTWSSEYGEQYCVSWVMTDTHDRCSSFRHHYSIRGTWTTGKFRPLIQSLADPTLWTTTMRLGLSGQEEFQFARDDDEKQIIYPAAPRAWKESVPVRGPEAAEYGKRWLVRAPPGEPATIQLRVCDGEITVTVQTVSLFQMWRSSTDQHWSEYYVVGTWNRWQGESMLPHPYLDGVFTYHLRVGDDGFELFNILLDQDPEQRLYPHIEMAQSGEGILCGPDSLGSGFSWLVQGEPDDVYEVLLDINEVDRYRIVRWEPATNADVLARGHAN